MIKKIAILLTLALTACSAQVKPTKQTQPEVQVTTALQFEYKVKASKYTETGTIQITDEGYKKLGHKVYDDGDSLWILTTQDSYMEFNEVTKETVSKNVTTQLAYGVKGEVIKKESTSDNNIIIYTDKNEYELDASGHIVHILSIQDDDEVIEYTYFNFSNVQHNMNTSMFEQEEK